MRDLLYTSPLTGHHRFAEGEVVELHDGPDSLGPHVAVRGRALTATELDRVGPFSGLTHRAVLVGITT
jgi:hypothetical protein